MSFKSFIYPAYSRWTNSTNRSGRKTTDRGQLILAGAIFCAALGIDTDLTLVYQLFALLLSLIVISRQALKFSLLNIQVKRILPLYATVGEELEYRIRVSNSGNHVEKDLTIVDTPMIVNPDLQEFMEKKEPFEETRNAWDRFISWHRFMWLQQFKTGITINNSHLSNLPVKATVDLPIKATPLRRGTVTFKSINVQQPDPFGLNFRITHHKQYDQLVVLPRSYRVFDPLRWSGGRHYHAGGVSATWSIGESDEFVSLREYREGDSLKKVHWASTAKREKLVVKEYQDEFFVRQAMVLDTDTRDAEIFEESISVIASFLHSNQSQEALVDLIFADPDIHQITAGRGFGHTQQQLQQLALSQKSPGSFDILYKRLRSHAHLLSSVLLVLTEWDSHREELVDFLRTLHLNLRIYVIHRESRGPADGVRFIPVDSVEEYLGRSEEPEY